MQDRHRISGIQESLPAGESLVWEGTPVTRGVALRVLHVRWLAAYFVALAAFTAVTTSGAQPGELMARLIWITLLAVTVTGLVWAFATLIARTTRYTVTNRRVIIQKGVVLPSVVNVPFERIQGLQLRSFADGSGDLVIELVPGARIGYLFLWPHVRPWRLAHPSPMLRSVMPAAEAAEALRSAYIARTTEVPPRVQESPTHYRLLDDDGIEVMNNRSPRPTASWTHAAGR